MNFLPIALTFPFIVVSFTRLGRLQIMTWALLFTALYIFAQGYMADRAHDVNNLYLLQEGDILRYRGLGVLNDPNDVAQFYVTLIPLLFLRWKKGSILTNVAFTLLPASILLVAIFFTHSRGAIVGVTAMVWFAFRKKLGITGSTVLSVVAAAAMIGLGMSGGRAVDNDDGGRVALWSTGLTLFKTHPLFGIGMGSFHDYSETGLTAHNSYILCLAELGITGYFCWMGMIVTGWTGLSRIVKMKGESETAADGTPELANASSAMPWLASSPAAAPRYAELALAGAYQASSLAIDSKADPIVRASPPDFSPLSDPGQRPPAKELARVAYIMQSAMVGLLVTCYFLSRSYSMVLYVTLGMAAAVRVIAGRNSNVFGFDTRATLKKVAVIVVASIIFLYLFIRFHGV